jgi:CSLREA domain-containing protein
VNNHAAGGRIGSFGIGFPAACKHMLITTILLAFAAVLCGCTGIPLLIVNSADDADDGDCNAAHCSLREAINQANTMTMSGTIEIHFGIGGGGAQTIQPLSALPAINVPVHINGLTQPGFYIFPQIELDGSLAEGTAVDGLALLAGGSTIEALAINRFSGNGIRTASTEGNEFYGNYIGTDRTGSIARGNQANGILIQGNGNRIGSGSAADGLDLWRGNVISGNLGSGIVVESGEKNHIVGNAIGLNVTETAALGNQFDGITAYTELVEIRGNVVSANARDGVRIEGGGTDSLQDNYIGTNAAGTAALGNGGDGVHIVSSNEIDVGGVNLGEGNLISGNAGDGVRIEGSATVSLFGNHIGTNGTGMWALSNGGHGVHIVSSEEIDVGGTAPGERNVISGNAGDGVRIDGSEAVALLGNYIGVNAAGMLALGNGGNGVDIVLSKEIDVGGTAPGDRNVVSGNESDGVKIDGSRAVAVRNNLIGTNRFGTAALSNHENGVHVVDSPEITIGGDNPSYRNVISGNRSAGIVIDEDSEAVIVSGNYIGTDISGLAALGNDGSGMVVSGADHRIGNSLSGSQNLISGNGGAGITVIAPATGIKIQDNKIGTTFNGYGALGNDIGIEVSPGVDDVLIGGSIYGEGNVIGGNLKEGLLLNDNAAVTGNQIGYYSQMQIPNGGDGIRVMGGNNRIGTAQYPNTIAHNAMHGVAVISANGSATGNFIDGNAIYENGRLGIALGGDLVPANDPGDADTGDNNLQNYPIMVSVFRLPTQQMMIFNATLDSAPNTQYKVEFFTNNACDPSGYGEGQRMATYATVTTDASGHADIAHQFPTYYFPPGDYVTATATDPAGNTSGFSLCIPIEGVVPVLPNPASTMTFTPFADPAEIFYGRGCTPDRVRIGVEIGDPPEPVSYVLLFVRLFDPKTGQKGPWSGGLSMQASAKNMYFSDVDADDVPEYQQFADAVLQYQFVAYDKTQEVLGRSGVYGDVSVKRCGVPGRTG